jgi:hypothetical protein
MEKLNIVKQFIIEASKNLEIESNEITLALSDDKKTIDIYDDHWNLLESIELETSTKTKN